jgi:hypothetical protein
MALCVLFSNVTSYSSYVRLQNVLTTSLRRPPVQRPSLSVPPSKSPQRSKDRYKIFIRKIFEHVNAGYTVPPQEIFKLSSSCFYFLYLSRHFCGLSKFFDHDLCSETKQRASDVLPSNGRLRRTPQNPHVHPRTSRKHISRSIMSTKS